jgi:hypothetical protein
MSDATGNILNCPTFKLADRRTILMRVYWSLFADSDCRIVVKGLHHADTQDETANWTARQTVVRLLQEL